MNLQKKADNVYLKFSRFHCCNFTYKLAAGIIMFLQTTLNKLTSVNIT